ncbi:MAG: FG-GAP repeat domain-containing protein, partial [Candidatus Binatia bacterium]
PAARKEVKPRPHVWSRSANGRWQEWPDNFPSWSYDYGDVAVADFDKDGRPDIAYAAHAHGVAVLLNRGEAKWELMTSLFQAVGEFSSRALDAADIDGDGWVDLVALAEAFTATPGPTGVRILYNQQGKTWRREEIKAAEHVFGDHVAVGDLDGRGRPAIILGSLINGYRDIVWVREGDGWRPLPEGIPDRLLFWDAALCDAGKRGKQDLFLLVDSTRKDNVFGPRVFRRENSSWIDVSAGLPQIVSRAFAVGDLDGSGGCTLAVGHLHEGSLQLFRLAPSQQWQQWLVLARAEEIRGVPYGVEVADLDADGLADLVVNYAEDPGLGGIQVWLARR